LLTNSAASSARERSGLQLMKGAICRAFGPITDLAVEDIAPPSVRPGTVLVDVHAAGVNYPDGLIVRGEYQTKPALPFTPGSEVAGVVRALGEGVTGIQAGDRVIAFTGTGGYAEQVAVPQTQLFRLPAAVDFIRAAGFLITYGTSYHALKDRARLQAGQTLLVLGAAGGVGLTAVELGTLMGARVIAAASSAQKLALAQQYGADELIDYSYEDLREKLKEITGGKGVDVVYDPVGGANSLAATKSLAWNGRHLIVGFAGGEIPKIPANLLLLKSADALGVLWGMSLRADPVAHAANIADLLGWLATGRLRPFVDATYPLERTVEALDHVMNRRAKGKVILTIR
jgi:NADPH2:quinone reductase